MASASTFDLGGPDGPPPPMLLLSLATAHYSARALHVIADAGVADCIGDAPKSAAAIAREAHVNADALERLLRLLAMHGIFRKESNGWAHTAASSLLKSDSPFSMRAFASMMGDGANLGALAALGHALATGAPSMEKVHPKGAWGYYDDHPDEARQFDAAMTAKSHGDIAFLTAALDMTGVRTIADIGGGRGHFLRAILDANPSVSGVLFDQPTVVATAADHPRLRKIGGDFFKGPPPTADLYLMTHIIHDWADKESLLILKNLRAAAPTGARLVVYELSLPEGPGLHPAKVLDVVMLAITGGRERTPAQYAALFREAGWKDEGVVPTMGPMALHLARA